MKPVSRLKLTWFPGEQVEDSEEELKGYFVPRMEMGGLKNTFSIFILPALLTPERSQVIQTQNVTEWIKEAVACLCLFKGSYRPLLP